MRHDWTRRIRVTVRDAAAILERNFYQQGLIAMTGFEVITGGICSLVISTLSETAKAGGGGVLARWLNRDISADTRQQIYDASGKYLKNYQERHGNLKVTCVRMDKPMKLDKLYTAVRILERSELAHFESIERLMTQYRDAGKRGLGGQQGKKQDGIAVANQEQFLMVLGGPGIGKSTLLKKVGLEALKRKAGKYKHSCLPVFLPLQRFKTVDMSIEDRIAEEFATCGFPKPKAMTTAMLKQGRLLVLLDGLDEVPKDIEDSVIEQIRDFVDAYSNNRFTASCRVAAYKGGFPRFKDVTITPFEDGQIQEFINRWFTATKDVENDTAKRCWGLLQRPEYAATRELAQTPLLLTLLCAVYDKQQAFPRNRTSLYGEALDVVLKEWAAEKRIHNDPIYLDLPLELERELLAELAFDSFVEDQLFFDKQDITERIKEFLISNLNAPKHLDSEKVLKAVEVQQGILAERARDAYSFSHLTFQEYLTAQHIVNTQQVQWLVDEHIASPQWREVFLLVAGLMRGKGADAFLQAMEAKTISFLEEQNIRALVEWAESSTTSSQGTATPIAKRATVIFLALTVALGLSNNSYIAYTVRDFARNIVRTRDSNIERDSGIYRDILRVIDLAREVGRAINSDSNIERDIARAIDRTIDNVHDRSLYGPDAMNYEHDRSARDMAVERTIDSVATLKLVIHRAGLLNHFPHEELGRELRLLKNNLIGFPGQGLADELLEFWSKALRFDLGWITELSRDETKALSQYLYFCHLMVQCKDAAVRVSPTVWQGIEDRLLTVPKDAQP